MTGLPRILTIMGSGETAPTMVKVHRAVLERLGPPPVPAVLLDTPFGFQENARELAQRVVSYFDESLRQAIEVASTGSADLGEAAGPLGPGDDPFAEERLLSRVRDARYIFAGPGSPSYALRQWKGTVVPSLLRETLEHGGAVTFSSAAALTLGGWTVPVYEIYKVGEDPYWLEGLDVLALTGLRAAVIPHYNNAEGGTHDTRFCYLGERRLALLEEELPAGAFVLGIDEHTAVSMDLDSRLCQISGNGVLTVRARGRSHSWPAGETVAIEELQATAEALAAGRGGIATGTAGPTAAGEDLDDEPDAAISGGGSYQGSPLLEVVRAKEDEFARSLGRRDVAGAVRAVLELQGSITEWSHDIPAGDALDRSLGSLRSLIVELGRAGEGGIRDPRETIGPFVEAMLELRQKARGERRFDDADAIRDRLGALGVEVRDGPGRSEWVLAEDSGSRAG